MFVAQSAASAFVPPAAPTIQGSTTPNSSGSIAIPTHAVGDLIIIVDCRIGTNSANTKPTASGTVPAWVDIDAPAGSNNRYLRTCYFVATATNHTSGTWSFPSGMACVVIRGQAASGFIGGHGLSNNAASTSCTAPAITPVRTDGSSLILVFHCGGDQTPSAAPAGYTRITNGAGFVWAINSKNSSTSDGSISNTFSTSATNSAAQIEICSY